MKSATSGNFCGLDRQRRFPRPGPAYRCRGDARRQGQDSRCRGRRGFGRQERLGDRRSRPPQHHLGLYGGHDLPDASREAVHRHHVPGFRRGPAGDRRRNGRRRRTVPLQDSDLYRACVRNRAKLAYNSVAAWLEGGHVPAAVAAVPGLDENLRLQDRAAQRMKDFGRSTAPSAFEIAGGKTDLRRRRRSAGSKRRSRTAPRT